MFVELFPLFKNCAAIKSFWVSVIPRGLQNLYNNNNNLIEKTHTIKHPALRNESENGFYLHEKLDCEK